LKFVSSQKKNRISSNEFGATKQRNVGKTKKAVVGEWRTSQQYQHAEMMDPKEIL
jgi:hypothetical protein